MSDKRGLTFVELLIAVMMVAILFVGLSTHLRAGMTVWQRVTQSTDMRQRERAAIARLERDLANAFVFDAVLAHYEPLSDNTKLSLPVFSSGSVSIYTVPTRENFYETPVQFITYSCPRPSQSGLWRRRWSVDESRTKLDGADWELILPECKALKFSYAYLDSIDPAQPLIWLSDWEKPREELPRLIKMEMELVEKTKKQGVEITSNRKLNRILFIPAGVLRKHT